MFEAVAPPARRPEPTREQFVEHYETPLILRSVPQIEDANLFLDMSKTLQIVVEEFTTTSELPDT